MPIKTQNTHRIRGKQEIYKIMMSTFLNSETRPDIVVMVEFHSNFEYVVPTHKTGHYGVSLVPDRPINQRRSTQSKVPIMGLVVHHLSTSFKEVFCVKNWNLLWKENSIRVYTKKRINYSVVTVEFWHRPVVFCISATIFIFFSCFLQQYFLLITMSNFI